MSYGLNLGWGIPIGDYRDLGGNYQGIYYTTTDLVQGSYPPEAQSIICRAGFFAEGPFPNIL